MKYFNKLLRIVTAVLFSLAVGFFLTNAAGVQHLAVPAAGVLLAASFIPTETGVLCFALNAKDILYPQGKLNPGGIAGFIYYAFDEDIESYPAALSPDTETATEFSALASVPISDPFVMKTGKQFYKLYCTVETGEVRFEMVGPPDSKSFENFVEISFPGNEAELYGFIAAAANRRLVAIVPEMNGKMRVVGHPKYPSTIDSSNGTSGKAVADGRATIITIKSAAGTPAPIYLAPVPLTPAV